jgi:hypothetical protein
MAIAESDREIESGEILTLMPRRNKQASDVCANGKGDEDFARRLRNLQDKRRGHRNYVQVLKYLMRTQRY